MWHEEIALKNIHLYFQLYVVFKQVETFIFLFPSLSDLNWVPRSTIQWLSAILLNNALLSWLSYNAFCAFKNNEHSLSLVSLIVTSIVLLLTNRAYLHVISESFHSALCQAKNGLR